MRNDKIKVSTIAIILVVIDRVLVVMIDVMEMVDPQVLSCRNEVENETENFH